MHRHFPTYFFLVIILGLGGFFLFPSRITPSTMPGTELFFEIVKISGAVIPHHDIVKSQRENFIKMISSSVTSPDTIILVGPNHSNVGKSNTQITDVTWQTIAGRLEPDLDIINSIGFPIEPASFQNEHSIFLIVGELRKYFPTSEIVPLIFKSTVTYDEIQRVHDSLYDTCENKNCLIMASVDMSHYQPAILANLHDDLTLRALRKIDPKMLFEKPEVDSSASLALLALWAKSHKTSTFELHSHTNSGELLKDLDRETTTHIMGWYSDKDVESQNPMEVTFLIGGDMMFARMVNHTFINDLRGAVVQLGDRLFWGTDLSLINLEGAISDKPVQDIPGQTFSFIFNPEVVSVLKWMHVNVVSLANNHSMNNGIDGLSVTRKLLTEDGIQSAGGPGSDDIIRIAKINGEGLSITVIGISVFGKVPDISKMISDIKKNSEERVIIMPHWGTEYLFTHNQTQEILAHAWIDAGADMVIGSHPNVIQDSELYKDKPIFYSLGNLLFDQTFSKATQRGMLIGGKFTENGVEFFGLPTQSVKLQPQLLRGAEKMEYLDRLYSPFKDYIQNTPAGDIVAIPFK